MNFLDKSLRWANILLVLVTLLAYLAPHINPAKFWQLSYLGLAYPALLLGNVIFIIFWLVKRNRYFLFSLGCILLGLGYFTSFFGWHFFSGKTRGKDAILVMTYNIAGFRKFESAEKDKQQATISALEKFAKNNGQPHILCIQEGSGEQVTETLRKAFGYSHYFKKKGTIIFSKYPFAEHGALPFGERTNSCVWADLKTPKGTVRVYSAHLQSNQLTQTATKIATKGDIREKQTWQDIRYVMRQYKNAVAIRAKQAQIIKNHLDKSPYPVILCGDMNDPPVSYVHRLLSEGLQDSFCEKGSGISSTFAGKLPALRIDYVLCSKKFNVLGYQRGRLELSDHFPVLVSLGL
jgi:endonuclease/exonuclease/phosphatase family metal-dependent hydrolase